MYTRALSRIHEVIFNNPEGVARGIIEYYWVYILYKARRRHALIFLHPGLLICKSQQCYRSNFQGNTYISLQIGIMFQALSSSVNIALWFPFISTASQDTRFLRMTVCMDKFWILHAQCTYFKQSSHQLQNLVSCLIRRMFLSCGTTGMRFIVSV